MWAGKPQVVDPSRVPGNGPDCILVKQQPGFQLLDGNNRDPARTSSGQAHMLVDLRASREPVGIVRIAMDEYEIGSRFVTVQGVGSADPLNGWNRAQG